MSFAPASPSGPPTLLMVLAGPAGSGKTTLCERLVREVPGLRRVITATTRPPRAGETDGVDYHFLSPETFDARLAEGAFLEWAQVHGRHRYGTLRDAVVKPLRSGDNLVMNIDVQGVAKLREAAQTDAFLAERLVTIFIQPPSLDELRARLQGRGTDPAEEIERRMRTAIEELRAADTFDHRVTSGSRAHDFSAILALWHTERQRRGWTA